MRKIIFYLIFCFCAPVFAAAQKNETQTFSVMGTQFEKKSVEIEVNRTPVTVWELSVKEKDPEK